MKKKVKIWMICSYFFVLAVFLMIYLAIQQGTERQIRELYTDRQLAVMNQTMLAVDEQVEAMTKLCLGIVQEPYVQYFPFVEKELDQYDKESVTKLLNNIRKHYTADPFVEDFYLFYENSGRIANANGFYQEDDFYRMEWSYEDEAVQRQVQRQLRQKGSTFLPSAWMENGVRRVEIITFFYDFGRTAEEEQGKAAKLVLLLKKSWLDGMVKSMSEKGRISIQRANDGVELYCRQGNDDLEGFQWDDEKGQLQRADAKARLELAEGSEPELLYGEGEELGHVVSWNGQKYLLTFLNSQKTGWIYESIIPYSMITSQMRDAVRPMSTGLFWYLLVGIPACILMAVWNYMPIQQLTGHMESIGFPEKSGHQSEVEYIRSGISNLHKKYEELELKYGSAMEEFDSTNRKLRKNRERIQEGLLFQLISGYWRDDQEIAERLLSLGITFPYPKFCLVTILIEEAPESELPAEDTVPDAKERSLRLFVLKNVAQEYLQPFGQVYPVPGSSEQLFLLMNLSENGYSNGQISKGLEALMRQMMEYFRREMQIPISIGVGTLCSRIQQLSESRRRSRQALEYCFIVGRSSLVIYDPATQEAGGAYRFDERIEKQFLGYVMQRDAAGCGKLLDQLYEDALKNRISVSEGKRLHMSLADIAMKAIVKSNVEPALEEICQDRVSLILSSKTLPEALPLMKELFVTLCAERKENGGERELEEKMINYITGHYQELDFSLQMCAEHFGVSPEHLSRTIKALTGRKFIDIVNQLRLERAKRYLLETDKKIEEIAELSGYGTAKSFFRSFKQAEGMPPGVWRKQIRKEE